MLASLFGGGQKPAAGYASIAAAAYLSRMATQVLLQPAGTPVLHRSATVAPPLALHLLHELSCGRAHMAKRLVVHVRRWVGGYEPARSN